MGGSVALRLKLVMALSCKDGDSVKSEGVRPW